MQFVCIRMLITGQYLSNDHTGESRRNRFGAFNFQTAHGQGFAQLIAAEGRIDVMAQPLF